MDFRQDSAFTKTSEQLALEQEIRDKVQLAMITAARAKDTSAARGLIERALPLINDKDEYMRLQAYDMIIEALEKL